MGASSGYQPHQRQHCLLAGSPNMVTMAAMKIWILWTVAFIALSKVDTDAQAAIIKEDYDVAKELTNLRDGFIQMGPKGPEDPTQEDDSTNRGEHIREAVPHEEPRYPHLITCCDSRHCQGDCGGNHNGFKWCWT